MTKRGEFYGIDFGLGGECLLRGEWVEFLRGYFDFKNFEKIRENIQKISTKSDNLNAKNFQNGGEISEILGGDFGEKSTKNLSENFTENFTINTRENRQNSKKSQNLNNAKNLKNTQNSKNHGDFLAIFPPKELIFHAFNLTLPQKIKVVILGQDPYHTPKAAMGLSFSVPREAKIPPSLRNIFKELTAEFAPKLAQNFATKSPKKGDFGKKFGGEILGGGDDFMSYKKNLGSKNYEINENLRVNFGSENFGENLGKGRGRNGKNLCVNFKSDNFSGDFGENLRVNFKSENLGDDFGKNSENFSDKFAVDLSDFSDICGDLSGWAAQGVLLLNAVLSVRADRPNSHAKIGWQEFTDAVILAISKRSQGVCFMLWGREAAKKATLIDGGRHLILTAAHPSPLARGAFFGCGHFLKCNEFLEKQGKTPIIWAKFE